METITILGGILAGAFPWISQLRKLDIHFEYKDLQLKSIFNFFASLFSLSVYTYLNRLGVYDFIYWPAWWVFISIAFILTILYLILFIGYREQVKNNVSKLPIFFNFLIYVLLFSTLIAGFSLLKVYENHFVVVGEVQNQFEKPVKQASVSLFHKNDPSSMLTVITDEDGEFSLVIDKEKAEDYNSILIQTAGYEENELRFTNINSLKSVITNLTIKKLRND